VKQLVIMRGVPGSGKSTLALTYGGVILSTDDFFVANGQYCFDPTKLKEAHAFNQDRTKLAMIKGNEVIVIDNTNILRAHIQPYLDLAEQYGYEVTYSIPLTPWAFDAQECFKRCTHNVPLATIERMIAIWEEIE